MTDIQCLRIKLYKADLMRILNPTACCEWIPRRKMNIEAWVKYFEVSGHQFEDSSIKELELLWCLVYKTGHICHRG